MLVILFYLQVSYDCSTLSCCFVDALALTAVGLQYIGVHTHACTTGYDWLFDMVFDITN